MDMSPKKGRKCAALPIRIGISPAYNSVCLPPLDGICCTPLPLEHLHHATPSPLEGPVHVHCWSIGSFTAFIKPAMCSFWFNQTRFWFITTDVIQVGYCSNIPISHQIPMFMLNSPMFSGLTPFLLVKFPFFVGEVPKLMSRPCFCCSNSAISHGIFTKKWVFPARCSSSWSGRDLFHFTIHLPGQRRQRVSISGAFFISKSIIMYMYIISWYQLCEYIIWVYIISINIIYDSMIY